MRREPQVAAVVVNHNAGSALITCVESMRRQGVDKVVVVDNASTDGSVDELRTSSGTVLVRAPVNLGYGAGVNLGLGQIDAEFTLVSNPDVIVHEQAVSILADALRADDTLAIVGPRILQADSSVYPSARTFPSYVDAAFHAILGRVAPRNRFTRRYRRQDLWARSENDVLEGSRDVIDVDWVSGACFLARCRALSELDGFDESYFMYVEDMDLCWRARGAGWKVGYVPGASITHLQGLSTSLRPYRMLWAHHRSALRFARRTASGPGRMGLPLVALFLLLRLVAECVRQATGPLTGARRRSE